jgi:hypothetical protein
MIAPVPGCSLVIIGSCPCFGGGLPWKALLAVQSLVIKMFLFSHVLPGIQGVCRRERLRGNKRLMWKRHKMELARPVSYALLRTSRDTLKELNF